MKIVLACRVTPAHRPGGMPFVVQDRAHALAAAGHDVMVLTTGIRQRPEVTQPNGVGVIYTHSDPEVYSEPFARECYTFCKSWKPDIVHLDSFDASNPWYTKLSGPIKACTLHGFGWGAFLTDWNLHRITNGAHAFAFKANDLLRESKALRAFDRVIGVSRHEVAMLREAYGVDARLVYNPIPDYFFGSSIAHFPQVKRYVCAAINGSQKRQFELAREAAELADVRLDIVQNLPRTHMPALYDASTALVLPTAYSQGLDLTVAEALARGRPVIVSEVGSYAREAETQPAMVTFPLGDVPRLAELMQGPLPVVSPCAAENHLAEHHARNWIEAITK